MKPGRNDPCPCGSGRKYKHCCQAKESGGANQSNAGQLMQTALAHHRAGQLVQAEALCRQALQIKPGYPDALNLLGLIAYQAGQNEQAVDFIRQAISANKRVPDYYKNLVAILIALGRLGEAEACLREMLAVMPSPDAHNNLGSILQKQGRMAEAIECYRRAVQLKPDNPTMWNNLGFALQSVGESEEAVECYRRALKISPDHCDALLNLGNALIDKGMYAEGIESYQRIVQIDPASAMAHNNLANALVNSGRSAEGIEVYRQLIQDNRDFAVAHMNLGNALGNTGRFDDVIAMYRSALEIKPDFADAHSNLIFCLDMMATMGLAELQEERRRWDEAHAAPLWREPAHANERSPGRRLRIGYVSADLRQHSASRTFVGILTQYDRAQFEVYAYSSFKGKGDSFTERFRQGVTVWRDIGHLSDEAAAQLIREDRIDILVDLSGHSAGNRLLVFARKPAPIQVTGWGYGSSTGMRAMDVFFTDPVLVPPEEQHYFTEEVRYQSSAWACYTIDPFPEVKALPALSEGVLTFGSFNRLAKVSEQAYGAWAAVLLAVPQSRLLLKTPELDDGANRERVAGYFTQAGVGPERLILQGKTPWNEHMQAYIRVDVALDPFPHGGGITTLEGLMMGVPVITLRWPSIAGRLSASIVTALGLTDWIAETPEAYVELALRKAADLRALAALRGRLRGIVSSVIGDQEAYVRSVEAEYRQLWQRWCAGQGRSRT